MRYVTPFMLALSLWAGPANAQAQSKIAGGPLQSMQRAQYCAKTHESDFYSGWVKNHCSKAPYGVRFEYLRAAWDCLCRGTE